MKKKLSLLLALASVSFGLVSCGGTTATPAVEHNLTDVFVTSSSADNSYGGKDTTTYSLELYSDNVYTLSIATSVFAYGMVLGQTLEFTSGTYTMGELKDGYQPVNLAEATTIDYASYSKAGGYDMKYTLATFSDPETVVKFPGGIATDFETYKKLGEAKTYYITYNTDDSTQACLTIELPAE